MSTNRCFKVEKLYFVGLKTIPDSAVIWEVVAASRAVVAEYVKVVSQIEKLMRPRIVPTPEPDGPWHTCIEYKHYHSAVDLHT